MRPINRLTQAVSVLVACTVLAGCATDFVRPRPVARHAPRPAQESVASADADKMYQKCQQRHLEHQSGKAPWNAKDLAQKKEDDKLCELSYRARQ